MNVCQVLPVTDSCSCSKDAQVIQQYTPLRVTKRAFGPYFDVILSMNGVERTHNSRLLERKAYSSASKPVFPADDPIE